jgi:glycosyltransferase involved in cell wall biosynthesis
MFDFKQLLDRYLEKGPKSAIEYLFLFKKEILEKFPFKSLFERFLFYYLESLVLRNPYVSYQTLESLQDIIVNSGELYQLKRRLSKIIEIEKTFLNLFMISKEEISLSFILEEFKGVRDLFDKEGFLYLNKSFSLQRKEESYINFPIYEIPVEDNLQNKNCCNSLVIIDYLNFSQVLKQEDANVQTIYLFMERGIYWQCLVKSRKRDVSNWLLADKSLSKQLKDMNLPFPVKFIGGDLLSKESEVVYQKMLSSYFSLTKRRFLGSQLYFIFLKESFLQRNLWLGKESTKALEVVWKAKLWNDEELGYFCTSSFLDKKKSKKEEEALSFKDKKKNPPYVVAHVVNVIKNDCYAPTKRLKTTLESYDSNLFDPIVISLDVNLKQRHEYYSCFFSAANLPKSVNAKNLQTASKKVPLFVMEENMTFEKKACNALNTILEQDVDIVVFHDTSCVTSLLMTKVSHIPRVFVEHGMLPESLDYDALVLSHLEDLEVYQSMNKDFGDICFSNRPVILKQDKQGSSLSKQDLGFLDDDFLLVTVSNSLEARMSHQMCEAVSEILEKNTKAQYLLVGECFNYKKIRERFKKDVRERIHFLGRLSKVIPVLKACSLYLNEFPVGGGFVALEAIEAGLPVVSMWDRNGPLNAREAANYFGKSRGICSVKIQDYIDLVLKLMNCPSKYQEWLEYTQKRALDLQDTGIFIKNFQNILLKLLSYVRT